MGCDGRLNANANATGMEGVGSSLWCGACGRVYPIRDGVLVAIDVAAHLEPAVLVYPCLVGVLSLAAWLVVFGS